MNFLFSSDMLTEPSISSFFRIHGSKRQDRHSAIRHRPALLFYDKTDIHIFKMKHIHYFVFPVTSYSLDATVNIISFSSVHSDLSKIKRPTNFSASSKIRTLFFDIFSLHYKELHHYFLLTVPTIFRSTLHKNSEC